eukprot:GILJ01013903.1.p1 GENE.GILJ01013903.1~~GILJ01013903.1.p1  ORF type:complete len:305 (-),score=54.39 GILJ01013903.1:136-1050(-)
MTSPYLKETREKAERRARRSGKDPMIVEGALRAADTRARDREFEQDFFSGHQHDDAESQEIHRLAAERAAETGKSALRIEAAMKAANTRKHRLSGASKDEADEEDQKDTGHDEEEEEGGDVYFAKHVHTDPAEQKMHDEAAKRAQETGMHPSRVEAGMKAAYSRAHPEERIERQREEEAEAKPRRRRAPKGVDAIFDAHEHPDREGKRLHREAALRAEDSGKNPRRVEASMKASQTVDAAFDQHEHTDAEGKRLHEAARVRAEETGLMPGRVEAGMKAAQTRKEGMYASMAFGDESRARRQAAP